MNRRRYRILHVLEATVGGTREHVLQILRGLDRRLFDATLLCSVERDAAFLDDIASLREKAGVRVIIVPMAREIRPMRDFIALIRIVGHLLRHRYDLVHTHSSKAGFLGRLGARLAGVRHIYHTGHVFYFQWRPRAWSGRFYRLLEWFAGLFAQRIIALSDEQREVVIRCGVARPSKLHVVENGVNSDDWANLPAKDECRRKLGIASDGLVVGMAARLEPQKGCAHFLRAARRVLDEVPSARFVLAGDGSIAATLQNLAGGLRLGDRFKLLGHCDDMRPFYGALDLFVLASLWEGMPYVVLEAMAAGLPVCATDLPGMRQIVMENETGSLVPPEDDEALARRIVELLRDEAKRLRFRERARHIVRQRFTAQRFLRQLESLYLGDLARQSPRSVIRRMS